MDLSVAFYNNGYPTAGYSDAFMCGVPRAAASVFADEGVLRAFNGQR